MKNGKRKLFLATAVVASAALIALDSLGVAQALNNRFQDRLMAPRAASSDIVIVAIDNRSIQELGVWPWPRSLHAQIIDAVVAAQPEALGYDVTFAEASGNATADNALTQALLEAQRSTKVVIASEAVVMVDAAGELTVGELVSPWPNLLQGSVFHGPTTLLPDTDGVVRLAPLHFADWLTGFAVHVAGAGRPATIFRIPFVGPPGSYQRVSAVDVINGKVSPETFAQKMVLVGATAPDLHDEYLTPFGGGQAMPGVEIQANIVQALREGVTLMTLTGLQKIMLGAGLALLLMTLAWFTKLRKFVVLATAIAIAYLLVGVAVATMGILLPITLPFALIAAITVIDIATRYKEESSRRAFVQKAFGLYVAPRVVEKLVQGDAPLVLGGVQEELTILFSDIRGFTSLSEKLSPPDLVAFLNEYLTAMTGVILEQEGTVDKYIGDAIMAFWGAPLPQPDHGERAILAALGMKAKLAELKKQWAREGKPDINIGIGLNTGNVVVGNIGSTQRFDYTVIGDDVNLASRLEGLTKFYGVAILISEATKNKLPANVVTRMADKVAVKGKAQAVTVFEVLGFAEDLTPAQKTSLKKFEQALVAYYAQEFATAEKLFATLAGGGDALAKLFAERAAAYHKNPPGKEWNGVFIAKEK